jgi:hypothetical protein
MQQHAWTDQDASPEPWASRERSTATTCWGSKSLALVRRHGIRPRDAPSDDRSAGADPVTIVKKLAKRQLTDARMAQYWPAHSRFPHDTVHSLVIVGSPWKRPVDGAMTAFDEQQAGT